MEFRILGSLEVLDHGRPLPLASGRQRALLALLLIHANEAVSADQLVEELWGERPPPTAQNAVQGYVSQLRKLLGPDRLETRQAGYFLRVEPGELDVDRFRELVRAGRQSDALEQFRGPPLADFRFEPFAQTEIARLEELRLAALEDRIDSELGAGRHSALVGELEALVGEHPLRERFRAQLMLALYRSGRQAEALAAYQDARRTLVEELGIDPSAQLQGLERAILRQDESLQPERRERLPTGTVTLLFTDIEGSTRLLHDLGDRYGELLAEHRRLLRNAVAAHDGVEVDAHGDAFFAAFPSADGALSAAEDAQLALAGSSLRVRIGVHTGEPDVTEEGYVGTDVHTAARIAAAGHGGQVLVSQATRNLVHPRFELRDLGPQRLKDLAAPVRLYQLGSEDFPPLKALFRTTLPVQQSPLVGRQLELREAGALLASHRLVTLTGPGGSGKTRLALQIAVEAAADFPDGVHWVPLQALRDAELVLPTIAQVMGTDDAVRHLADMRCLLLLDNLEQVIAAATELGALLHATPNVKLLVTSREPLRIEGEREYAVEPLTEKSAVELFRDRAVDAEPLSAVIEICRRVDCLPLAIELAAARTKLLPPEQLLARLDPRLPLLTGGRRDAPARQQTLRAAIEWSYALLPPGEQRLLERVSVFAGGFTIEAAQQVCDADLELLQSVVEKSLLRRHHGRLSMLDTIREFALELLERSGAADEFRRRHAEHVLRLAGEIHAHPRGLHRHPILRELEREDANIRSALEWLLASDPDSALRLADHLQRFWWIKGRIREADYWLTNVLQFAGARDPVLRADALRLAGDVASAIGDDQRAIRLYEEGLAIASSAGAKKEMAATLINLGRLEDGLALYREIGWEPGVAVTLHRLAEQALDRGDFARARGLYGESVAAWRHLGETWGLANVLHSLGDCALEQGSLDEAADLYKEVLRLVSGGLGEFVVAHCLAGLSAVAAASHRNEVAARLWGAVEAIERRHDVALTRWHRARYQRFVDRVVAAAPAAREEGAAMAAPAAVAYALEAMT